MEGWKSGAVATELSERCSWWQLPCGGAENWGPAEEWGSIFFLSLSVVATRVREGHGCGDGRGGQRGFGWTQGWSATAA